ncbi:hypothetical protein YC2023_110374 [Brassica napus]
MKKIDPVETVVVMEEVVTEMENIQETRGYNGGGCGYSKGGVGGVTVEVDVDTGMEVVVVMDTKVVVDTEVDTFGNFVDETSFTNLIHTISFMELYKQGVSSLCIFTQYDTLKQGEVSNMSSKRGPCS